MQRNKKEQHTGLERPVVRTYKDSLFRMIFSEKKELLALYNALNNSHYKDKNQLEIKTLENAIYLNMKNDLSFLIDARLYLYEHQSTYSPNMPLRDLFYVADQFQGMIDTEKLYKRTLVKIPAPEFVVFYNGVEKQPERREFCLSDAYLVKPEDPKLELKVMMLNVNHGYNRELMRQCKTLRDYAIYVEKVRIYTPELGLEKAVEKAVEECIQNDVLKEFLLKQRKEAIKVSIYEFDQAKYEKYVREEEREEGIKIGLTQGLTQGLTRGKAESLLLILSQYGLVSDPVKATIMKESNADRLEEMIRKALQVKSVEEFMKAFDLSVH